MEPLCQEFAATIQELCKSEAGWRALLLGSAADVTTAVPLLLEVLGCETVDERPCAPILDTLETSCAVLRKGAPSSIQSQGFDYVISLELLDGLGVKDVSNACSAALDTLRPGGVVLFVSEELEAFGSLKRAMRALRPAVEQRVSVSAPVDGERRIHVYRRAGSQGEEEPTGGCSKIWSQKSYPPGWGEWQQGWVEPARPCVNVAKIFRPTLGSEDSEEQTDSEPAEWISDALQLVLMQKKGRGVVVSRPVKAGELLLVSKALFLAPADQLQQVALGWLLEASPQQKQQFYSLYDGSNGTNLPSLDLYRPVRSQGTSGRVVLPERLDPERIYQILALNGFQADKFHAAAASDPGKARETLNSKENNQSAAVSGLWTVPSLMNHACIPSTVAVPLTKTTLAFLAAYDLPAGAEVTSRYCKLQMPVQLRRSELKRQKGFDCTRPRCTIEAEKVPPELAERLVHVQERAASLNLPPHDFLAAIEEVTAVTLREVTARVAADSQLQVLLSSYAPVLVCRAMTLEHLRAPAKRRYDAWKAVRNLLQELEPSSPNHLYAASCTAHAADAAEADVSEALKKMLAAWLVRHGVLQATDQQWSVTSLAAVSPQEAVERFVEAMKPPGTYAEELKSEEGWGSVLALLCQHAAWASTKAEAPSQSVSWQSKALCRQEDSPVPPRVGDHQWETRCDGCQLKLFGIDASAQLDISTWQLRVTPSVQCSARGCRYLDLDLVEEMGRLKLSNDFDLSRVKARVGLDKTQTIPVLCVEFRW